MEERGGRRDETWVLETGRGDEEVYERLAEARVGPDVLTPMGQVAQWGNVAEGARRSSGWKQWLAYALVAAVAVPILGLVVAFLVGLVELVV